MNICSLGLLFIINKREIFIKFCLIGDEDISAEMPQSRRDEDAFAIMLYSRRDVAASAILTEGRRAGAGRAYANLL